MTQSMDEATRLEEAVQALYIRVGESNPTAWRVETMRYVEEVVSAATAFIAFHRAGETTARSET